MTTLSTQSAGPCQERETAGVREVCVGDLVLGPRERFYLQQVIDSNRLSYGPLTQEFERRFARLHGCAHACFTNSGTSALQIAVHALREQRGWQPGDEVIVPAVTFVATVNVVLLAGLKPVLVDVRPDTYTLDPDRLQAAITPRTRAVIPVHLLGLPADMAEVGEVARRHSLAIIEDSCETMFARYRGRPVGSLGDIGCFSTYIAHFLVTGVGGLATTNDPELARLMRSLMNHGRDSIYISIDDDGRDEPRFREIVERRFRFERVGFSYRATELEAAIGLGQLEQYASILAARRAAAEHYTRELSDLSDRLQLPTTPDDREHAFMVYGLVCRELGENPRGGEGPRRGDARPGSMRGLVHFLEARGIETRDMLPLIHQPVYRDLLGSDAAEKFPVAHWLYERGFYVGCHQYLTVDDRRHVVGAIREYFERDRS